jgi:hypothetical protein
MPRFSIVLGACVGLLAACGGEGTSDLFRAPGSPAGATGGVSVGSGTGGFGAAGFGSGTGGAAMGGAAGFYTGGAPSTGGLVGQGGIIGGTGGIAGGLGGSGGIVGNGGFATTGGSAGSGGSNDSGGSTGDGGVGGSAGNYALAAAADCNGTPCATAGGNACCVIVSNNGGVRTVYGTCTPPGVTCAVPFSAKAFCDGPEDCAHGSVCCGTLGNVPGLYTDLACVQEAGCAGTGKQIMCHPGRGSSCTSGVCNKAQTLPDSYGVCG